MSDGLLVIDKPRGPTSHDVVAHVRKAVGIRRVGHAGTLDPMATGVMVVAIGRATRLLRFVQDQTKEYVAKVRFGIGTDTLDADGLETWRQPMPIDVDQLRGALGSFLGEIEQVPPMFSALKVGGTRLHALARAGQEVEREARTVQIYRLDLVSFEGGEYPSAVLNIECSKGTYIRSLADDLARSMRGRAHLEDLRRMRVGQFHVDQALILDDVGDWQGHLLDPAVAVDGMPSMVASPDQAKAVADGRPLATAASDGDIAIFDPAGRLLGVYESRDGVAKASVVLH